MFLAGAAGYQLHRARLALREALPAREIHGVFRCDRVLGGGQGKRFSALATLMKADAHVQDLIGQLVYVNIDAEGGHRAGASAWFEARGILTPVAFRPEGQGFESFLADSGAGFRLSRGEVLSLVRSQSWRHRLCERGLLWCSSVVDKGIAEKRPELARILRAMLLGKQSDLTKEQTARYRQSGTMHLFAISGQHIVVIGVLIEGILALLGFSSWRRSVASLGLLWVFVDITGASPSAVRAFLMVAVLHTARVGWLPMNPLASLAAALLIEFLAEPLVFFTAGFQLSYGIVATLVLLALPLNERLLELCNPLSKIPKATWSWWQQGLEHARLWAGTTLSITYAASVISLPAGVAFFGLLSHGGMVVNVVMVPASSLVIFSGFLSLVCGLCHLGFVCSLLNHASALILWGMDALIVWFVGMPSTHTQAEFSFTLCGNLCLAAVLFVCLAGYHLKWGPKSWYMWAPGSLVLLVLVCCMKF